MFITCDGLYSCSPAFRMFSAKVIHVINARYELWKMKTVAFNTNILSTSNFQFFNQLLQRLKVYRLICWQSEDISPGQEQKCYTTLSITIILDLAATWKQTLLLCLGIVAMFSVSGFRIWSLCQQAQFKIFLLLVLLLSMLLPFASCLESCVNWTVKLNHIKKKKMWFFFFFYLGNNILNLD